MVGYYAPEHYMEIPLWIAIISGMLPEELYKKTLMVISKEEEMYINEPTEGEYFLFSVMETNRSFVKRFLDLNRGKNFNAILGGYVNSSYFSNLEKVIYLDSLNELGKFFSINIESSPNYNLFRGEYCIPRISLSSGCLFNCSFCSIPRILTIKSEREILNQIDSLKPLNFRVLYLDDKTFGQASNYRLIGLLRDRISQYNPDFYGFTVQTTPSLGLRNGFLEEIAMLGVKYIELGVEIVDDKILEIFNKPYRTKHLNPVCDKARNLGLKIIPNLIMGFPNADYRKTIEWIRDNQDIIPMANIYFLADYEDKHSDLPVTAENENDRNENKMEKSWLTPSDIIKIKEALREIFLITSNFQTDEI
jgi:hypothetical protein